MNRQEEKRMGDPLDRYREIVFRSSQSDDIAFTDRVLADVRRRQRSREGRRHSLTVITSVLLLFLTLQGVESLLPQGAGVQTITESQADLLTRAEGVLEELTTTSLDQDVSSFIDYLNSDMPIDPISGLALFEDEAVEEALKRLADLSLPGTDASRGEQKSSGKAAGSREG